jgi:hypothetical protein
MAVKLGPITANFTGRAHIIHDDSSRSGVIIGSGNDKGGGSRAAGEVEYTVRDAGSDQATVQLKIRALLAGHWHSWPRYRRRPAAKYRSGPPPTLRRGYRASRLLANKRRFGLAVLSPLVERLKRLFRATVRDQNLSHF